MANVNPRSELLPEPALYRQGDILVGGLCFPDSGPWEIPKHGLLVLFEDIESKQAYAIHAPSVSSIRWSCLNAVAVKVVEPCAMEHPSHRPIFLPPGKYKMTHRQTYVPEPEACDRWQNLEKRKEKGNRLAVRLIEAQRLDAREFDLSDFLIQRDIWGELFRIRCSFEPLLFVRSAIAGAQTLCGTEGPLFRVPPEMKTAHEAIAWTFGVPPEDYRPMLQT